MSKENLDVVGVGNAIVDILVHIDEGFLEDNDINKGTMTLIDHDKAEDIYSKMGPGTEMSGGSAANTIVALGAMGSKVGYIGKVADDVFGNIFRHDIKSTGIIYDTNYLQLENMPTSHCLILITPDAQRTMCTSLGASTYITPLDVDTDIIERASVTYLEGYLFDRGEAKNSFKMAAKLAHNAGKKVSLTLSDPFCVERHRKEFLELVENDIDILFANEAEIKALYQTNEIPNIMPQGSLAIVTRSEKGSLIINDSEVIEVPAVAVDKVIDTTGAGDLYAAGFLYGYTRGKKLAECGDIASLMAREIITQIGARAQIDLVKLLKDKEVA